MQQQSFTHKMVCSEMKATCSRATYLTFITSFSNFINTYLWRTKQHRTKKAKKLVYPTQHQFVYSLGAQMCTNVHKNNLSGTTALLPFTQCSILLLFTSTFYGVGMDSHARKFIPCKQSQEQFNLFKRLIYSISLPTFLYHCMFYNTFALPSQFPACS